MLARIFLCLSATSCLAASTEKPHSETSSKKPELLELLGPSNILQTKLDVLELAAPLESLIAPAFQVGVLDGLENFVRGLLETLTGLDEINTNDSDFFKDLDATSSLIQMLENVHRITKSEDENPETDWHVRINKLLDDMETEVDGLPERIKKNANQMMSELRDASNEKAALRNVSEMMLERTSSNLANQLLRIGNTFGPRAAGPIARLGGAGIFQTIHDDIRAILGDPRTQAAPREVIERIGEIGTLAETQRENMINRNFSASMMESWRRFLSLPMEVLRVLDRNRSVLLGNLFSIAVSNSKGKNTSNIIKSSLQSQRLNSLGIIASARLIPAAGESRTSSYRSFRNQSTNSTGASETSNPETRIPLMSRYVEVIQNSADALANTLWTPVTVLLSPFRGRDAERHNQKPAVVEAKEEKVEQAA